MPGKTCAGCLLPIKGRDYLQCPHCEQTYDLDCASIPEKRRKQLPNEYRRNWRCPSCKSTQRKQGDNSNTPVRQAQVLIESDSENVTTPTIEKTSFVTEDRLRDILRQEITSLLNSAIKEHVTKELSNIQQQIASFHESLSFFNEKYETVLKELEDKRVVIKSLKEENANLTSTVNNLSSRLTIIEQTWRECNVEINGIPERKSENLFTSVVNLAKSVNHTILESEMLNVTRVAKLNKDSDRPRSVILKLNSARRRDELLAAVATYNKKNPSNKLNTSHLGLESTIKPVYVTEHLSPTLKSLHAAARQKSRDAKYKYVWVRNGRIYVRKDETYPAIHIHNLESLHKIK
ncbi:uncharacterized protein LOC121734465 [Aricia agestis]|uniref:uncharacterized protein LOC121734465 n=1 Tax=Aricia agestis TaxID=91739 RepID=UPI001C201E95|nr:uncharacterized protein LOC121734465 [Aricia agestis]